MEEGLKQAHASFTVASALMSAEMLEQSLLYPKQSVELGMTTKNIMSVNVPEYHFSTAGGDRRGHLPLRLRHDSVVSWTARWTPCPPCFRIC